MTAQERLDYLLETVATPTNTLVTIGVLRETLSTAEYGQVLATFAAAKTPASSDFADVVAAAEMESSFIAMSGPGLLFSSETRQATIDQLAAAGGWSDETRDTIKDLGYSSAQRWESEGYETEPTIEQVQAELDTEAKQAIVTTTRQAINDAAQPAISKRNNATGWLDSLDTSEMTEAEVQAYCTALIASADGNPSEVV